MLSGESKINAKQNIGQWQAAASTPVNSHVAYLTFTYDVHALQKNFFFFSFKGVGVGVCMLYTQTYSHTHLKAMAVEKCALLKGK